MEFFKSDVLKKEYKSLVKEILRAISNGGSCARFSCEGHKKLNIMSNRRKEQRCSNCCLLKSSIEILVQKGDEDAKDYLSNFINDYFNLSELTVSFSSIEISNKTTEKKNKLVKETVRKIGLR